MAIDSGDLIGGGGDGGGGGLLILEDFSAAQTVSSGASGDLIIITPSASKRAVLTGLSTQATTQSNIEITVGAKTILTNKILVTGNASVANQFNIGTVFGSTVSQSPGNIDKIIGGINEVIKVTLTSGTTGVQINYSTGEAE